MNKFEKVLRISAKGIKEKRAELLAEDALAAFEKAERDVADRKRAIVRRQLELTDIYPDSKLSTMVAKADFEASKWLREMKAVELELLDILPEEEALKNIREAWFTEVEEEKGDK